MFNPTRLTMLACGSILVVVGLVGKTPTTTAVTLAEYDCATLETDVGGLTLTNAMGVETEILGFTKDPTQLSRTPERLECNVFALTSRGEIVLTSAAFNGRDGQVWITAQEQF